MTLYLKIATIGSPDGLDRAVCTCIYSHILAISRCDHIYFGRCLLRVICNRNVVDVHRTLVNGTLTLPHSLVLFPAWLWLSYVLLRPYITPTPPSEHSQLQKLATTRFRCAKSWINLHTEGYQSTRKARQKLGLRAWYLRFPRTIGNRTCRERDDNVSEHNVQVPHTFARNAIALYLRLI